MPSSPIQWIEIFMLFATAVVVSLLCVWLMRAFLWIRNRFAKKFKFSKVEALFLLVAPPVLLALWVMYA